MPHQVLDYVTHRMQQTRDAQLQLPGGRSNRSTQQFLRPAPHLIARHSLNDTPIKLLSAALRAVKPGLLGLLFGKCVETQQQLLCKLGPL